MAQRTRGHAENDDERTRDVLRVVERVAPNLRKLRLKAALTQEGLAEAAGIDATYVQRLERGVPANITIAVLGALARALDVDVAKLLRPAKPVERPIGRPPLRRRR